MAQVQTISIELPLKALVWEVDLGQVWFGYNDVEYIARRYGVMSSPTVADLSR